VLFRSSRGGRRERMIQLTEICYDLDGNPYERTIIVPDSILVKDVISNRIGGGKSIVIVPGIGGYEVKETRNEVARRVLEWRLASMDFQQDGAIKRKAIIDLYTLAGLAGLEEPKDES